VKAIPEQWHADDLWLQPETRNGIAVWGAWQTAETYDLRTAKQVAEFFNAQVAS
jgi:hypothetical protein